MSSVAGARSLLGASDETFDHICDPCNFRGVQKQGTSYCKHCKETFCQTCADVHKGQTISRNHDLTPVSRLSVTATPPTTCNVLCDCSQNSAVVDYCQDHDDVICQSCCFTKHRACKTMSIGKMSASYQRGKFTVVAQKADMLNDETERILDERQSELKSNTKMTKDAKEDMRKYRQEINKKIDIMENEMLKEIDRRESKNRQHVDGHISSCTTTKQLLQSDLKLLNDAKKTADKADMFAADVKVSKRLADYERLLRDIRRESTSICLTFKNNDQILDMLSNTKSIGTLMEQTIEKTVFTDLKFENLKKKKVKISKDKNKPTIRGCTFMPDGKFILCDSGNENLKLLDKSFTPQDSLDLPSRPLGISMVNDTTAIITLPDQQQLQYIDVAPRLAAGRVIHFDKTCYDVRVVGSDIYVTCCRDGLFGGEGEVRILDKNGNLRRRLGVNQDNTFMFTAPEHLTVSARSDKIYVSDWGQHTLTCLKTDGTVIFQYKDPELRGPRGVCVDDEDNVMVCGVWSNNHHVVTSDGKKHSVILTSKDGIKDPISVAYRQTDKTLIVGCWGNDNLYVFQCVAK